ncbi:MAG: threonine-phosphate decarboxylase [Rhizobiales bacterium]|nr:threonine-phosphate decarboxylase [Hyphomicrobiales bacterium]
MTGADLIHGGALSAVRQAFPHAPAPWLDLSTGINPWPYPHGNMPADAFTRLPDADLEEHARAAMAAAWGCEPRDVALTPGSQAAIQLLPHLLGFSRVAIVGPTYGEHAQVWRQSGAEVFEIAADAIEDVEADCVVICNPNNPDGRIIARTRLAAIAQRLASRGGRLVADEAFADGAPENSLVAEARALKAIVLRSFGKFFGLAGARLGAIVADEAIVGRARMRFGPWAVSGPALAIAQRAYRDDSWRAATIARLKRAGAELDDALRVAGVTPAGGTLLFRWVCCRNANAIWRRLAERGVYVRRFAWSDDFLRIGIPADESERERLVAALRGAA